MLIGEVSRSSGVSARMLRHYDEIGLVRPTGRSLNGYREYSTTDLRRLFHVESLRSLGLTLSQVGDALDTPTFDPDRLIATLIAETQERLDKDRELLARLHAVERTTPQRWDDVLDVILRLQHLSSTTPGVRQRAALGVPIGADLSADTLTEAALREPVTNVASTLVWALAQGGGADVDVLTRAMGSDDQLLRRRATVVLAGMAASDEVVALLSRALRDDDPVVRAEAALYLGRAGIHDAVPTLIRMVIDGTRDVDAADALTMLSAGPVMADRIVISLAAEVTGGEVAAGGDPSAARIRVLQTLYQIGGSAAVDALRELSHDDDHAVARVAMAFLTSTESGDDAS